MLLTQSNRIRYCVTLLSLAFSMLLIQPVLAQTKEQLKKLEETTGLKGKKLKRHLAILQQSPPYKDDELQAYVTEIGNKILAQSEHAHLPYKFIVRDTEVVNAFVNGTPYVFVERGLLTLLNSEAELAAVMAHEIGHNVAKHSKKLQSKNRRDVFLANLASFLVGNSGVGNAIMAQSSVSLYEYKREAELEADSFAAKYLAGAGYEPDQLVNALAQLRDNAILAATTTGQPMAHHGLAASHPRNDKRIREAIEDASILPPGEGYIGREEYRAAIDGLVYGPNYRRNAPSGMKRYSNPTLGITFVYPETWSFKLKGSKVVLKDAEKTAQMTIEIEPTPDRKLSSEEAIKLKYPEGLVDLQKVHPDSERDLGTVGARPAQRVALIMVARNTYHFLGIAKNNQINADQDRAFVDIIRSFRPMTPKDRTADHVKEVYFERLEPGETFESMAKGAGLDDVNAELELRVLNGYYPDGEAEPGTWIKKLRQVKIEP
ncbi:hypothetical protein GCM10008090_22110 [Arenicella chitinivorans]|uniref:Peptidase M48 domain-containing protein n=2 Tax=Arenicella chitinivorans TaxID=1329800 RepID=A0A918RUR3_9GAMM|nr:hypothetical protein GCM10008090_22110 [Arenicella chitinivorans]